jgi:hypothetical protein
MEQFTPRDLLAVVLAVVGAFVVGCVIVLWPLIGPALGGFARSVGRSRNALIVCGLLILGAAAGAVAGGPLGVLLGLIAGGFLGFAATSVKPSARDYVARPANDEPEIIADDTAFAAFELPERLMFVRGLNVPNADRLTVEDYIILDSLARQLAAGIIAESTVLPVVYDGRRGLVRVSKGSAVSYTVRRDMLRAMATVYGWQAPAAAEPAPMAQPRRSPIAERELPADAKFFDEQPAEVH